MSVLLSRNYGGYAAGTVAEFPKPTEDALIAQKFATTSAAKPTAGAVTTTQLSGKAAIATGASSVVITNALVNTTSKITAQISQSSADATLTSILRVIPAAGSFTITGNAAATADTEVQWNVALPNLA